MPRIEWSRYSGDDVEHLVAMLVCRENPNAERIRPSSGDGGIDVRVPTGTGFEVYQIKKFAQNLGSSEKAQIVKSLKRLVKYAKQSGLPVIGWHLTMPLDPTPENATWFTTITNDVNFPCTWKGLPFIDGLAAKHPDIVDYYLRDGRERLAAALSNLSSSMSMFHAAGTGSPITPTDATPGLVAVFRTVNALDPHYRYEFDVAATMRPVPDEPWLMFATTEGSEGAYVTYRVYAKFKEAATERPVTVQVQIPTTDPDVVDAIDDFRLYGKPFKSPPVAAIEADLPGGLGGSFENGVVRLGSVGNAQEYALRFQAVDPEDRVLASTTVNMRGPWTGPSRKGARVIGTEVAGCFTVEIRTDLENQRLELDLAPAEIAGRPVTSILEGIRVLDQVGEPNRLRIAPLAGPVAGFDPLPPFSFPANPAGRRLVEALATIQDHTTIQITVPADDELSRDLVVEVDRAARILRGEEVVTTLTSADIGMTSVTAEFADGPAAIMLVQPLTVTLGGERIVLGEARVYVPATQASLIRDEAGGPRIRLAPMTDRPLQMQIRLASESDRP